MYPPVTERLALSRTFVLGGHPKLLAMHVGLVSPEPDRRAQTNCRDAAGAAAAAVVAAARRALLTVGKMRYHELPKMPFLGGLLPDKVRPLQQLNSVVTALLGEGQREHASLHLRRKQVFQLRHLRSELHGARRKLGGELHGPGHA